MSRMTILYLAHRCHGRLGVARLSNSRPAAVHLILQTISRDPPKVLLHRTKCRSVRWRIRIQRIHAYDLVVCARRQVFPIFREADRMNGSGVMADRGQLLWFRVIGVVRVQDGFGGPYSHVSVCCTSACAIDRSSARVTSSAASGLTNLQQQSLIARRRAKHGSCILRNP